MSLLAFLTTLPFRTVSNRLYHGTPALSRARPLPATHTRTRDNGRRQTPSAMIGWLRELMGNEQETTSGAKPEELRHAVLDKPLVPPDGVWAPPLKQATFGLGWYVFTVLFSVFYSSFFSLTQFARSKP